MRCLRSMGFVVLGLDALDGRGEWNGTGRSRRKGRPRRRLVASGTALLPEWRGDMTLSEGGGRMLATYARGANGPRSVRAPKFP